MYETEHATIAACAAKSKKIMAEFLTALKPLNVKSTADFPPKTMKTGKDLAAKLDTKVLKKLLKQELEVLEEGRFLALDLVADELDDPADHEYRDHDDQGAPAERFDDPADSGVHGSEHDQHSDREGSRKREVIEEREHHDHQRDRHPTAADHARQRDEIQHADQREDDDRDADPVQGLVGVVAVVLTVSGQPLLYASHGASSCAERDTLVATASARSSPAPSRSSESPSHCFRESGGCRQESRWRL